MLAFLSPQVLKVEKALMEPTQEWRACPSLSLVLTSPIWCLGLWCPEISCYPSYWVWGPRDTPKSCVLRAGPR